jgi:transposase
MAHAYSLDLRRRIVGFVERGGSCREAARRFEVSPSFVVKLIARVRRTGSPSPGRRGGSRGKLWRYQAFLIACVEARPDIAMPELAAELEGHGGRAAPASLSRFLRRMGYRFKKNSDGVRARA